MSLEVMTTIGAVLGGLTANYLPGDVLKKIFAVFLAVMALVMWQKARKHGVKKIVIDPGASIQGSYFDQFEQRRIEYSVQKLSTAMVVSFFAGKMSGLLGVGGGIIKVPVMNIVCGVPIKVATATSNFMIGVTAVASAFIYFSHGNIHPFFTAAAVLGVLLGSILGTKLGVKMRSKTILSLFIVLMFLMAARMFF